MRVGHKILSIEKLMMQSNSLWSKLLLLNFALALPLNDKNKINFDEKCPSNWFTYHDSCYFTMNELLNFENAQIKCWEKKGSLFLAETLEEYKYVTEHSGKGTWSWIGITQHDEEYDPQWVNSGGVEIKTIDWMRKPYTPLANGWTKASKCAAHLNNVATLTSYTLFFPCTVPLYSICERNNTLISRINL